MRHYHPDAFDAAPDHGPMRADAGDRAGDLTVAPYSMAVHRKGLRILFDAIGTGERPVPAVLRDHLSSKHPGFPLTDP